MKQTLIAIAASVALLTAPHASAQAIEGFVMGGICTATAIVSSLPVSGVACC